MTKHDGRKRFYLMLLTITLIDDIMSKVFRSKVKIVTEENHMPYDRITQLQSRMIIGTKQTLKAMNNNEVEEVFIAADVDAFISNQLIEAAKQRDIPYTMVDSKRKLGKTCNIDVGASVVSIKNV